jgi:hypothetical protein
LSAIKPKRSRRIHRKAVASMLYEATMMTMMQRRRGQPQLRRLLPRFRF